MQQWMWSFNPVTVENLPMSVQLNSLLAVLCCAAQVAEGVATAGVVVSLARKYRVSLPVLTAVAQVLDNNLEPAEAVAAVMNLPQIEER
jgi:glycerol-3-phosphate dehydrogenase (NAD+)